MGLEFRQLGRTDVKVSSLCLGTMMYGDQMDAAGAFAQMDRCFDAGINFFDTAELYTVPPKPDTQGESERIVGQWIKDRGRRNDIVLATKVTGRSSLTYLRDGENPRVTPEQIRGALEASLDRLQTDYVDLYQIHWPDRIVPIFGGDLKGYRHSDRESVPIEDQLGTLAELVAEGKIRHVGLSNETAWGTMAFLRVAERHGLPRVVSIQNVYNLVSRTFETGLAEVAMQENVGLLAYSPIAQGMLSGKYLDGDDPAASRRALYGRMDRYETPSADEAIRAYVGIARDFGLDPSALALQFVTTRPWLTSNIFGASNDAQLDVALASVDIPWTDELEAAIAAVHARLPNPCP